MADILQRAVEALVRSTRVLGEAVSREDPVALATALDVRIEAVEWLQAYRGELPPEVRELLASIARADACLEKKARASLREVAHELSQLRTARGSLGRIANTNQEPPPRFVSRRA